MSSDLLAEFDTFYQAPESEQNNTTQTVRHSGAYDLAFFGGGSEQPYFKSEWPVPPAISSRPAWDGFGTAQPPQSAPDDDWGDFEDVSSTPIPLSSPQQSFKVGNIGGGSGGWPTAATSTIPLTTSRTGHDTFFNGNINHNARVPPSYGQAAQSHGPKVIEPPKAPKVTGSSSNILFDADEEFGNDDDDFGDFESVQRVAEIQPLSFPNTNLSSDLSNFDAEVISPAPKPPKHHPGQLSSAALQLNPYPYPQAPKSPSYQQRNPFSDLSLTTPTKEERKEEADNPITAWPSFVPEQQKTDPYEDSPIVKGSPEPDWRIFEDVPAKSAPREAKVAPMQPAKKAKQTPNPAELRAKGAPPATNYEEYDDAWDWDDIDGTAESLGAILGGPSTRKALKKPARVAPTKTSKKASAAVRSETESSAPPTNIPPPSVILSIFPQLFNLPQSSLFQAASSQSFSLKNRIMSDPSTIDFLRAYIVLATVAARVIAGRKFRWKRDSILSQSMKMGPSAAGGRGGMKLTGVDRAETAREDREATDLVRIWGEQVGRLRSAVAIANGSLRDAAAHLAVPEIGDAMPIRTEGLLTAPKPCVLCGLRREERVARVDVDVEDSFGEWWVEHWGHRGCRNFWSEHSGSLSQR